MIALSIILTEGQRKIPLQYGKRIVGRRMVQGASQSLPIKVNAANVMPIIFASSLLIFPSQLANYLKALTRTSQGLYKLISRLVP